MAYVNFSTDALLAPALDLPRRAKPVVESGFSALEWSVVALAERDRIGSLGTPGRLSLALGTLFWSSRRNPALADPRLEALRRMAVLTWRRGDRVAPGEIAAFVAAGFTAAQHATLSASIATARSHRRRAH